MNSIFDYMTVISAVLVSILILIQTRGASLGAGFGSSSEVQSVRRGADKSLHQITIVMVIIFASSLVLGLLQ